VEKREKWCGSFGAFVNVTRFVPVNWRSQLHNIRRLSNYGHVEVWLEWLPDTRRQLDHLLAVFDGEQVIVHAPFVGLSLVAPWRELRAESIKRLSRAALVASELGAAVMTIHPGVTPAYEHRDHVLDRVADAYAEVRANAGHIALGLENMPDRQTATVEGIVSTADFVDLLDRDPDIKFTLDIGHAVQNGNKYHKFLMSYGTAIVNMHLHDGVTGGAGHLRLGSGELDVCEYLQRCVDAGYAGFVSLETLSAADTLASWRLVRDSLL
jgi:L-ribulose-5-phosphate 3-epimerase